MNVESSGQPDQSRIPLYTKYPRQNIILYNTTTVLHYGLGAAGIVLGYQASTTAYWFAGAYALFAFVQMYILRPLMVCPRCIYYSLPGAVCVSALNLLSRRIARAGEPERFPMRGTGLFCHHNLYMFALFAPILAMLPALILNFSVVLLTVCPHCRAKYKCPNAIAMGLHKT